jgi:enterochelin esterase-like enzyme
LLQACACAGLAACGAGAGAVELVSRGVLPGKATLDEIDGACDVSGPRLAFGPIGSSRSGTFFSAARHRTVGYTIAYPAGHGPGSRLPLIVALHAYGGDHRTALAGMSPAQAVALRVGGSPLPPVALVTVDGGNGYWNPHPGDDPLAMLVDELIPMCRRLGLGAQPHGIGAHGISMGGFGVLLLAEREPQTVTAVAAISPAIWTSYAQARSANAGAYASAANFTADDAVTHAGGLQGVSVRIAVGDADPFKPGVQALARELPAGAVVEYPHLVGGLRAGGVEADHAEVDRHDSRAEGEHACRIGQLYGHPARPVVDPLRVDDVGAGDSEHGGDLRHERRLDVAGSDQRRCGEGQTRTVAAELHQPHRALLDDRVAGRATAGLQPRVAAADRRMARERELLAATRRGVDVDAVVGRRVGRRHQEGGLGQVRPARDSAHRLVVEPLAVQHHCECVPGVALCGEHVDLEKPAGHGGSLADRVGRMRGSATVGWRHARSV